MNAIFMIENGKALEMVKEHIAERAIVNDEVFALAKELDAKNIFTDRMTGVLRAVLFNGETHPEFCKPKSRKSGCYPKKGSSWAKRLAGQNGYRDPARWISKEFEIPLSISYQTTEGGKGWRHIGNPLAECGFLYLSKEGPYAMWVPDVTAIVAKCIERGEEVNDPAASFKLEFDGCRRIEEEEWKILVLQNDLAQKKASSQSAEPVAA